jgi:hypothetical protein
MASVLDEPRLVQGVEADARAHTLFVPAEGKRMRLALLPRQPEGSVLWVEGLGAFATDVTFAERLHATELETRRKLGLVHRDELGDGLPNDLIPSEQGILQPYGLFPEDVAKLRGLTELELLDLRWCDAGPTEPFVEAVGALTTVRELRIAELTDATVAAIARLPLRRLSVVGANEAPWRSPLRASCAGLTDAGLDALLRLRTWRCRGSGFRARASAAWQSCVGCARWCSPARGRRGGSGSGNTSPTTTS